MTAIHEVIEEFEGVGGVKVSRMGFLIEIDVLFSPLDVRFFGAVAVAFSSNF